MSREHAKLEARVARVTRQLKAEKPVAKRDRGLQQLLEQATGDPATVDTTFADDGHYTLKADVAASRDSQA